MTNQMADILNTMYINFFSHIFMKIIITINSMLTMVQVMVECPTGDKPLPCTMMSQFLNT